ncbi:MAG: hypothetical protein J5934_05865 [Succinivibrio sp.]|nr:hypothetical protein [Succinivibrio sp.]
MQLRSLVMILAAGIFALVFTPMLPAAYPVYLGFFALLVLIWSAIALLKDGRFVDAALFAAIAVWYQPFYRISFESQGFNLSIHALVACYLIFTALKRFK